jgi:hypothetical protein
MASKCFAQGRIVLAALTVPVIAREIALLIGAGTVRPTATGPAAAIEATGRAPLIAPKAEIEQRAAEIERRAPEIEQKPRSEAAAPPHEAAVAATPRSGTCRPAGWPICNQPAGKRASADAALPAAAVAEQLSTVVAVAASAAAVEAVVSVVVVAAAVASVAAVDGVPTLR